MKRITTWLSTPYYFNPSPKFKFKVSISIGLFVFLFLYLFKPFYINYFGGLILEYTSVIGIVTFLSIFFIFIIPPLIFKNYFNEDNWTIGRNLLLIQIGIIFTASWLWYIGNLFRSFYDFGSISYLRYLSFVYLLGTFPVVIFIFFNEKNVREKRKKRAEAINSIKKHQEEDKKVVLKDFFTIYSNNKKEHIKFKIDDLVYITSQGNYASFFLLKNTKKELKEIVIRITLTKISQELDSYVNIIRCHKSYIINSKYIMDVKGNARGYLLKSDVIPFNIPVSRSFSKKSIESILQ